MGKRALTVDPVWLIHSFDYYEYYRKDKYGAAEYKESVEVANVRIDQSSTFTQNKTEGDISVKAIIFCFASATKPFMPFKEQSKVVFDEREHIIVKVIPQYEPHRGTLWSYELEVL